MNLDTFGGRLRLARFWRELSQESVGRHLGTTKVAVSRWENNKSEPTLEQIRRLASFLKCHPMYLAFGQTPKEQSMERDNWENSGIDDFTRRQAQVCRLCGDDTDEDDTPICAACRAQPARISDAD